MSPWLGRFHIARCHDVTAITFWRFAGSGREKESPAHAGLKSEERRTETTHAVTIRRDQRSFAMALAL